MDFQYPCDIRVQPPPLDSNRIKQGVYWIKAVGASASSVATSLTLRICGICIANHELFQLCHSDTSVIGCAFDVVRVRRRAVRMAKYGLDRFLRHSQAIEICCQARRAACQPCHSGTILLRSTSWSGDRFSPLPPDLRHSSLT